MKIVSWNINSLRAHEIAFRKAITELNPDIFCLQEIRVREDQQTFLVKGFRSYMNPAERSQYYGTGVYIKNNIYPRSIVFDSPLDGYDYDGRIMAIELNSFYLVNSYWPFSAYDKNNRWLNYRLKWNKYFQQFILSLQKKKSVVICGDMNMVRCDCDSFDMKSVRNVGCFYPEEHDAFERLIETANLVDSYSALLAPDESVKYTVWTNSKDGETRCEGRGFRIDYFLVEKALMQKVRSSKIMDNIYGSDHCPILLDIELE